MLSVITLTGPERTEQQTVEDAEERKSSAAATAPFRSNDSAYGLSDKISRVRFRMYSNTAKLAAPWGMDRINCAPAPRVRTRRLDGRARVESDMELIPMALFCKVGVVDLACKIVFIAFAGCVTVCAILRLTAPQSMDSQKLRVRRVEMELSAFAASETGTDELDPNSFDLHLITAGRPRKCPSPSD
mmetsp:Transcript_22295/g.41570  ORF Transcript_22295/g.41570 Transcript_22295/m.41570 type:complete len:187 (-) Transcript_22295:461-1021(-)